MRHLPHNQNTLRRATVVFGGSMLGDAAITQMVSNLKGGGPEAFNALFPIVYDQLKKIAYREKQKFWNADTISATALVHEVYLKLLRSEELTAESRAHFFALCAVGMRQVIMNYIEQKVAQKRGGDWHRVTLSDEIIADSHNTDTLLTIDKSLKILSSFAPDLTSLVEMRFFAGMSETEIALVNGCTERTVRRNWAKAKAILNQIIQDPQMEGLQPA